MNWTLLGMLALIVIMVAAPFVALRSVSYVQARRSAARAKPLPDDVEDPDKPTGFW
ncbi:MAG: hypothetical protein M3O62_12395 [Pseudomonadota bacterium]|nr:hypothetical protein [Pseudomonadota bacterium]